MIVANTPSTAGPMYRHALPQLGEDLFLTDAGMETDIIFNRGIAIREFAAHTLLPNPEGFNALETYFEGFLALARQHDAGFILDAPTWKAHRHWADDLGETTEDLQTANEAAVALIAQLRDKAANRKPVVLNAQIGPRGDAYAPEDMIEAEAARDYFAEQIGWLARTPLDMVTGMTFTQAGEAEGFVLAAGDAAMPSVISFTLETDGTLPSGQSLAEAIAQVDANTNGGPAYYMINCAHPDHFERQVRDGEWRRRIRGVRANASRRSHAELDEAEDLDDGNPVELARQYRGLVEAMPWLNIFGACCGGDLRHVTAIAKELA